LEAEATEYRRARTKRLGIRFAVAAVVIVGALFAYSVLAGDDESDGGDEDASASETVDQACDEGATPTSAPPDTAAYSNPELAAEVLSRDAPELEPPADDTAADAVEPETEIEGEGEGATAGSTLTVLYCGKIADGTVFDTAWDDRQVFTVTLGQGQVIPGWESGLEGATIGERRRIVIGSEMAYGAQGSPPAIPPDAPLAFVVDVVDVAPGDPAATSSTSAPPAETTTSAPPADSTTAPTA
jgi:FKBP-type peptidyl-prolyl cis-trans isomerase